MVKMRRIEKKLSKIEKNFPVLSVKNNFLPLGWPNISSSPTLKKETARFTSRPWLTTLCPGWSARFVGCNLNRIIVL